MNKVTIVIAAYGRVEALNLALRSVYKQTLDQWRVLIVADCCTDELVAAIDQTDERVRVINLPRRCGHQYGPNSIGIHLASTPYVAFLNHDDLWLPDHLEIALTSLANSQGDFFMGKAAFCQTQAQTAKSKRLIFTLLNRPEMTWRCVSGPNAFFEPASSWVVSTAMARSIGNWAAPDSIRCTPVMDWLQRAAKLGCKFCFSSTVSALKINLHQDSHKPALQYFADDKYHVLTEKLLDRPAHTLRQDIDADLATAPQSSHKLARPSPPAWIEAIYRLRFAIFCRTGFLFSMRSANHGKSALQILVNRTGEQLHTFPPLAELVKWADRQ